MSLLFGRRSAGGAERDPERLEDRLQDVLAVLALEQAHVDGQARALGQLAQEARDRVALEAADALAREVDVRDDERPLRRLERDRRERLLGGRDPGAVARGAV